MKKNNLFLVFFAIFFISSSFAIFEDVDFTDTDYKVLADFHSPNKKRKNKILSSSFPFHKTKNKKGLSPLTRSRKIRVEEIDLETLREIISTKNVITSEGKYIIEDSEIKHRNFEFYYTYYNIKIIEEKYTDKSILSIEYSSPVFYDQLIKPVPNKLLFNPLISS